jgi:hypothetical protein
MGMQKIWHLRIAHCISEPTRPQKQARARAPTHTHTHGRIIEKAVNNKDQLKIKDTNIV